jgi:hypothetical protein
MLNPYGLIALELILFQFSALAPPVIVIATTATNRLMMVEKSPVLAGPAIRKVSE